MKCKNCKWSRMFQSCAKIQDKHNPYTGHLIRWSNRDANEYGDCPDYQRKWWKLGRPK